MNAQDTQDPSARKSWSCHHLRLGLPLSSRHALPCAVSVASASSSSSSSTEKGSCSACGGAAEEDRAHDPLRAGLRLQGVFPMLFCTQ